MTEQRVAIVTGASRGAGKGIALALGRERYKVYVTGRSQAAGDNVLPGTIHETAQQITEAGGTGIAVACDHADESAVAALFERVSSENDGRLDLLVNNATFVHDLLTAPQPFWEKPIDLDRIFDVGLKSSYDASWHAAKMMVPQGRGLIVFVSSPGAGCYMHGPAYGAQKAGHDKMAYDMAVDLKPTGVSTVALWLGILRTERTEIALRDHPEEYAKFKDVIESPEYTGRIIHALAMADDLASLSGQAHYTSELGRRYGVTDIDGSQPAVFREMLGGPRGFNDAMVY